MLPGGSRLTLDPWQKWLLRHALEIYPDGHPKAGQLRYRQIVISVGRQNGKSVLGAIFALYALLRERGALVIGIASSAEQARIVYERTLNVIKGDPDLAARFDKLTDTRGIRAKDGGRYEIKASKSAAVQGLDASLGVMDELHITKPALWDDLLSGSRARRNGVVIGITTAGDDQSDLLIRLYKQMHAPGERFGFFVWEAPETEIPDDLDAQREYIRAANPAVATGRIDVDDVISDIAVMDPQSVLRYVFNRFTASSNTFVDMAHWRACAGLPGEAWPDGPLVFSVDRTPEWTHASVVASVKDANGLIHTEVVASLVRPTQASLLALCTALNAKHRPATFVADGLTLGTLAEDMKRRGLPVAKASLSHQTNAAARFYALIRQGKIRHASDPLLTQQLPRTVRKNVGEAFRISRADSSIEIDTVIATALAVLFAETAEKPVLQIF